MVLELPPRPDTLSEFYDSKYWDAFFKTRGGRPFECFGDWKLVSKLVTEQCGLRADLEQKILIPGCGNSTLSADMYDAGFIHITNIDFSRVVIAEMLRLHVRSRSRMRWLVMDMTKMQLPDDSFDVVLDKGGLDALLGGSDDLSGVLFLSEVKRVLKAGGRFACITLVQQHVIELLLGTFTNGWHLSIHELQLSADESPSSFQPFLVIAKQEGETNMPQVSLYVDSDGQGSSNENQMQAIVEAVHARNVLRSEGLTDFGTSADRKIKPQNIYDEFCPGRRLTVKLVSQDSRLTFTSVVLDAKEDIEFQSQCAVFLVPKVILVENGANCGIKDSKGRAHEWLFASAQGQWEITESSKAGRLILVSLDPNPYADDIMQVKNDLSPLVTSYFPLKCRDSGTVTYLTQGDGITSRNVLAEIESSITGPMVVEDVNLTEEKRDYNKPTGAKLDLFRRLVFKRNPNLIQSEVLLVRRQNGAADALNSKHGIGKKKKKPSKEVASTTNPGIFENLMVDHGYLVNAYHAGMVTSFVLIARNLERWLALKHEIRLMVVGLGAGSLPMFVHDHFPIDSIQIVELDSTVGDVARVHFGFIEDERMKLHIGDGLVAVQSIAAKVSPANVQQPLEDHPSKAEGPTNVCLESIQHLGRLKLEDDASRNSAAGDKKADSRLHVLIVDADSTDLSLGWICPSAAFLEDSFLLAARAALLDGGMLVMNVVSRVASHHNHSISQLKRFFEELYQIEVCEDVNRVFIALPQSRNSGKSYDIMEELSVLKGIVRKFAPWGNGPNLRHVLKHLERLK